MEQGPTHPESSLGHYWLGGGGEDESEGTTSVAGRRVQDIMDMGLQRRQWTAICKVSGRDLRSGDQSLLRSGSLDATVHHSSALILLCPQFYDLVVGIDSC